MWKCEYCGNNNSDESEYCSSCRLTRYGYLPPIKEGINSLEEELNDLWSEKSIYRILAWLKSISGIGIAGFGCFWYGFVNYIIIKPQNIYQQQVAETYFLQAEVGLLIVGIGMIIMEIKKNRKTVEPKSVV